MLEKKETMATNTGKKARRSKEEGYATESAIRLNHHFPKLNALSYRQQDYIDAINTKDVVFAIGSAGSGKSYVATHWAAEQLYYKKVDRIILTRPAVEACGESLGFLPGDLVTGKLMPYLIPYMETFNELLGKSYVEYCLKVGAIEAVPLAFMRGRSFKDCVILGDELQSASPDQLKMLLTRIGKGTKMLLNGDLEQRDKPNINGLEDAMSTLRHLQEVEIIQFYPDDCVRSGLCKKILKAYAGNNYS